MPVSGMKFIDTAESVSRGATTETILGVAAIVGLQAIEYHTLYRD